ncbi:2-dehydropantoate 2-reductase [Ureibacillus sp. FSL K6-8385]|uniref:2-dehydropantoate 2-reductase n=1 Tax=Ureibacillus terrenus TaxID=118246 RepID=A0A540V450_9BACL|nr:2-dehydropantoate 2-reductase [Ureibacillus terrenus]MED3660305.1 2-dehydropantoate 2-reductase [Ureibacillus terrenus]MED3762461.1 2-dehydropantoate 2-reductase [Ureibacillus terrenus]TQE91532.1 2-dehydropantoate 2-reductase [Ureibacillus terrenus]
MKIVVIGAGSVGMLLASFLAERFQVTVLVRRKEQEEAIRKHGIHRINLDGTITRLPVNVSTKYEDIRSDSFVIVAVKYTHLKEVLPRLEKLPEDIPLLFVQNGLAHFDEVLKLPQKTIGFGSCQFGAQKENDHTVNHRGIGVLKLAVERGKTGDFQWFSKVESASFPVQFVDDAEKMLFEKALYNCFINPLTAVLQIKNGELLTNRHAYILLKALYEECMEAFPERRETVSFEDVVSLCKKTASNSSSMLQDRLLNRKTEVESIVGAVIKKAEKNGKSLPILKTLYHLVLALEGEKT